MTDITLLDGSIGQELVKRAGSKPTPLWSTSVMMQNPGLVSEVHQDYFRAGATIATANSYAVHRDRLVNAGIEERFEELVTLAMAEARNAVKANGSGRIAAALGPLGASYRPDICPPPPEAAKAYAELVSLMNPTTDLFLIETAASAAQAHGALLGCAGTDKPVWLAVTVDDDEGTKLRSGEPLSDLAPLIEEFTPQAVLINCSRPEAVSAGLEHVSAFGLPFGAYANGFTRITGGFLKNNPTVDALQARKDLGTKEYARFAMSWIDQGATIIGGCCEVGPDHIAELAKQLTEAGHTIT